MTRDLVPGPVKLIAAAVHEGAYGIRAGSLPAPAPIQCHDHGIVW